jgi:hypothetical protein
MTTRSSAAATPRWLATTRGLDRRPATWLALGALVVLSGAFVYHETRGTAIWFDEWSWALHRRGSSIGTFLDPHNEHLSLIPVAIYKVLFATAGIGDYAPYRIVLIVLHLACCVLVFVYARTRVNGPLAVIASAVMLLFGPGWENILWPFQITWLISLGAGIGTLLALDRGDRGGDVVACVLLAVALASSGIGVPILLGVALEMLLVRRAWSRGWLVIVPAVLYGLWWLGYQQSSFRSHNIVLAPEYVVRAASSTLSALAGLGGSTGFDGPGSLLTYGPALLVATVAVLAIRLLRLGRVPARVAGLMTMVVSFWLLTALNRAEFAAPYASRYLYVDALLAVLLAVELARGARVGWTATVLVAVVLGAAIVSNIGALRDAARLLRGQGQVTAADLGALEIGRALVPPGYIATGIPGYPFVIVPAASYFSLARSLGTPAASPTQITKYAENARVTADGELIHIHGITPIAVPTSSAAGAPPVVDTVEGGAVRRVGACVTFTAARSIRPGQNAALAVTVPPGGVRLRATGGPSSIAIRRFADAFQPLGTIRPRGLFALEIAADRAAQPWHIELRPTAGAVACGAT